MLPIDLGQQVKFLVPFTNSPGETFNLDEAINEATINISPNRGFIEKETLIISKGEVVEGEKLIILESLKKEYEVNSSSFSDLYLIISWKIA